jgi:hypothetical protein
MKPFALCLVLPMAACTPGTPHPDVVARWNEQAVTTGGPAIQRTLAMVHIAMFDAVNAIEPRYSPYLSLPAPPQAALAKASAAAAAHGVLIRLFPEQRTALGMILVNSLVSVPEGPGKTEAVAYGDLVAQAICAARETDHISIPGPIFTPDSTPGRYQLTTPGPSQPVNTNAPNWRPFALRSASQFRPEGPPAVTSGKYARDFEEVRRLGGSTSTERTLEQEEIARWHAEQVPQQFNRIARAETAVDGRTLLEHARLFALLNLALADAMTSVFEAKYAYLAWRPVTAIRNADADGNPYTSQDAAWSPFLLTPAHPEYPSAHGALQSAASQVMTAYFGAPYAFRSTSSAVPGLTRSYESFGAFRDEGALARIFGGLHFRAAVEAGVMQGKDVADWVLDHYLRPLEGD